MPDQADELRKIMAKKREQGYREPLKLAGLDIVNCDGIIMATVDYTGVQTPAEKMVNFGRRIVACVNACRGITTKELETGKVDALGGPSLISRLSSAIYDRNQAQRERDETRAMVARLSMALRDAANENYRDDWDKVVDEAKEIVPDDNTVCPHCYCITLGNPEKCPHCGELLA